MNEFGKALVFLGLTVAVIGLLLWKTTLPGWFGRLPGDLYVVGKGGSFHFPIVTCLLISAALSLLLWLFRR